MAYQNFVNLQIIGNLGTDPQQRFLPDGKAVTTFSVAITPRGRADGEGPDWYRVTAWGRQAELCNEYLKKGSKVFVQGALAVKTYSDKDGNRRQTLEVSMDKIEFLTPKTETTQRSNDLDFDEEIPF